MLDCLDTAKRSAQQEQPHPPIELTIQEEGGGRWSRRQHRRTESLKDHDGSYQIFTTSKQSEPERNMFETKWVNRKNKIQLGIF